MRLYKRNVGVLKNFHFLGFFVLAGEERVGFGVVIKLLVDDVSRVCFVFVRFTTRVRCVGAKW